MINFLEEIEKFKPALEIEQLESAVSGNEVQDMMDVLQQITKLLKENSRE